MPLVEDAVVTNNVDARQHITYRLNNKDVFRDEGRTIAVLDLKSDAGTVERNTAMMMAETMRSSTA